MKKGLFMKKHDYSQTNTFFHLEKNINITFPKNIYQMSLFAKNIHRIGFLDRRFGRVLGSEKFGKKVFPEKKIVSGNCSHTFFFFYYLPFKICDLSSICVHVIFLDFLKTQVFVK